MLANNHICKVQSQNFAQLQIEYMRSEIDKPSCSLLMTLRQMFNANQEMTYKFASEAYIAFVAKGWCDESDFQLRYEQIATYGVMLSNVVWGYDIDKGSMSLYTTSVSVLQNLAQKGILKGKNQPIAVELPQYEKTLYESDRIRKSLSTPGGRLVSVRLDTEIADGRLQIKPVIPRTAISLDTRIIIPFTAYQKAVELLRNILQQYILRIKMGDKVRDVTLNKQILASIYGEGRANQLVSYIPDIYTQRFYVPSVGASKYTTGVTNIHLEDVDEVKAISLADIDMSEVNMDYTMVPEYYKGVVAKMSEVRLAKAAEAMDLLCKNAPVDDLRQNLMDMTTALYPKDLWDIMKAHPKLFKVDGYSKMKNRFGSEYTPVEKPKTVKELSDMLNTGVYKILITKRNGKFSTIIGSNDLNCIKKVFGENYMKFESEGVRLRRLRYLIEKQGADVDKAIAECNAKYLVHGDRQEVLRQIDILLREVDMNKTVVKQANLVLVRNLEATESYEYYKNLDLRQIDEIYRLQ